MVFAELRPVPAVIFLLFSHYFGIDSDSSVRDRLPHSLAAFPQSSDRRQLPFRLSLPGPGAPPPPSVPVARRSPAACGQVDGSPPVSTVTRRRRRQWRRHPLLPNQLQSSS